MAYNMGAPVSDTNPLPMVQKNAAGTAAPVGAATDPIYTAGSRSIGPLTGTVPNTLTTYSTAGLCIGGLVAVATGLPVGTLLDTTLLRLRVRAANQASGTPNYLALFFNGSPTASTLNDNAAVVIADADTAKAALVVTASWAYSNATTGVATATVNGPRMVVDASGYVYFALIATGSTPLLAANALPYSFEAKY